MSILVNGSEKIATGLTKETTVDQLKLAMLNSIHSSLTQAILNEYGLFEQWQNNERLLEGNTKILRILKAWSSLPGDQLSQVKFIIKRKFQSTRQAFKYCTISPEKPKRDLSKPKYAFVRKQLQNLNQDKSDAVSVNSIATSAWSSERDEEENCTNQERRKRYASIKSLNRIREASIKRISSNVPVNDSIGAKIDQIQKLKFESNRIEKEIQKSKVEFKELDRLKQDLARIDNLIMFKSKLIQSYEQEVSLKKSIPNSCSVSSLDSIESGISTGHSEEEPVKYKKTQLETLV